MKNLIDFTYEEYKKMIKDEKSRKNSSFFLRMKKFMSQPYYVEKIRMFDYKEEKKSLHFQVKYKEIIDNDLKIEFTTNIFVSKIKKVYYIQNIVEIFGFSEHSILKDTFFSEISSENSINTLDFNFKLREFMEENGYYELNEKEKKYKICGFIDQKIDSESQISIKDLFFERD